jgi:uncharacterized protein YeaO (DUF488 family)
MKTMTCRQLGGACDEEFHAETFDEMKQQSMKHGHEMFQKGDKEHVKVMSEMKEKMESNPEAVKEWMDKKKKEFDALPEDN